MGLEWHNRNRSSKGRFAPKHHTTQIHVYCTWAEWQQIKAGAMMATQDMSEFCRNAALAKAAQLKQGPVVIDLAGNIPEDG